MVSVLDRVYQEGKTETLTHPFVKDEPILTREDKSYKETKRILNELVKYSKSHHRSVVKNWILMFVIFTLLFVQGMLRCSGFRSIFLPSNMILEIVLNACVVTLMSVTTCFDVPCCWRFGNKNAKFSMFRNLQVFRMVLLVLHLVQLILDIIVIFCVLYYSSNIFNSFLLYNIFSSVLIFVIVLCALLYVLIMLVIKTVNFTQNMFRPVLSCRNVAYEIIMLDIFGGDETVCKCGLSNNVIETII